METHYVCTGGCKGVSDSPNLCQAETCPKHGTPMAACTCDDDKHDDVMKEVSEESSEDSEESAEKPSTDAEEDSLE